MMTRRFIPWAIVYFAGLAFIWWLGGALFRPWPTGGALVMVAALVLWTNVAFRYAFLMGVHAARIALGIPAPTSRLIALWHRDENPLT